MKYKKYPSYKDSGVEWLGKVPEHWELKAIKNVVKLQGGFAFKSEEFIDEGTPIIRIGDIQNNILFENCKKIKNSYELSCIYEIKKFDTLIALSGATTGKTCFVENNIQKSFINQRVARLPYKNKFIYFILNSDLFQKNILLTADGSAQDNISNSQIENMKFSLPSIKEQQQIANFLDKATAKIDTLIEKQTKQIELLKEKRQAVISHAVTKGINPNVPMKDSGVEWLGEIPEHWEAKKLKFVLKLLNKKEKISNQTIIALENIESWSGKYIESESNYQGDDVAFCVGDILFGKLRPYLAKVFLCSFDGIAFGDLLAYRPTKDYASKYGFYSLISEDFIKIVDSSTYGTKMPRASSEFLSEMRLTVPPLKEQQQIVNYLDEKTLKIDTLIEKSKKSIELLKEKRTALISAAVTGKIDVREEV